MSPRYHEIDPCTNFDQYVCEGWYEKNDLRADQPGAFTGTIMQENSQQVLRHVLESPFSGTKQSVNPSPQDSSAGVDIFDKLQGAYHACMEEEKIKAVGSSPLLEILHKIEELFPAIRPHDTSEPFPRLLNQQQKGLIYKGENQLSNTIAYMESIGVSAIVAFGIGVGLPRS